MGTRTTLALDQWPTGTAVVAGAYDPGTPGTVGLSQVTNTGGTSPGSTTLDSAYGRSGLGLKMIMATGTTPASLVRVTSLASNAQYSVSFFIKTPASNPASALDLHGPRGTSGMGTLQWSPTGKLQWRDLTPTTFDIAAAGVLSANTFYRVTVRYTVNTTTGTAGTLKVNVYTLTGTAVSGANIDNSTVNLGTSPIVGMQWGSSQGIAGTFGVDEIQIEDGITTEIADYVASTPLSTPVITLGATTNPTVVGGSDGRQVVSWSAVANATSYEAWLAPTGTPTQGDFTRVATGVTSPYTFLGLSGATYSVGVKAKA